MTSNIEEKLDLILTKLPFPYMMMTDESFFDLSIGLLTREQLYNDLEKRNAA